MALSPQLLNFKSSGVYRLEFDKSQTANIDVQTIRLVVGHSKKGPYNTPVLIRNVEEFTSVFGSIDTNLEKAGMFFHRSAFVALSRGPILALNVADIDSNDQISFQAPVTAGSTADISSADGSDAYADFFNIDKFWFPEDKAVLDTIGNMDADRVLNFINIKQEPITVIVRKAQNVPQFDITAREWYGEGNVPAFLNDFDYVSDFMVDVFVFKGEFNPAQMDTDPVYGAYFTNEGLIKGQLSNFAALRQVTLLAQYTGSLIPAFKDLEGKNLYIETMINSEARRTGLFCAINEDLLTDENGTPVDLVGHGCNDDNGYEALSYIIHDVETLNTINFGSGDVHDATSLNPVLTPAINATATDIIEVSGNTMTINSAVDMSTVFNIAGSTGNAHYFAALPNGTWTDIVSAVYDDSVVGEEKTIITCAGNIDGAQYVTNVENDPIEYGEFQTARTEINVNDNSQLFVLHADVSGAIANDRYLLAADGINHVEILSATYNNDMTIIQCSGDINQIYDNLYNSFNVYLLTNAKVKDYVGNFTYSHNAAVATLNFTTHTSEADAFPIKKGHYIASAEAGRLARVLRTQRTGNVWAITCDRPVAATWSGYYHKSFEEATTVYKPFVLAKANVAAKTIAGALSQLSGTGLFNALIDKNIVDFRYIVDTFASYENGSILNKTELSFLAHERQNAAAILNAPMVKDFKASTDPSFTDSSNKFDTIYIKDGGNLDKNPSALYALPSINEGANYAFYYAPGILVRDGGKDVIVPPAAYVSNNYIDKYTNALPWSIVAGPRRGVVSGANVVGVEYAFDKADRDILEPFGINPIVFQRGAGLTILGNKTAQQSIKSALSSAHVREVLIYIQEGMAKILKDYVFEFNTAQTRLEIKTLADSFLQSVKADTGIYDFKNVMDQSNNTDEVIDNNMGIIDTFVEPVKGLEIIVHRTTILNTGEIRTGNFS